MTQNFKAADLIGKVIIMGENFAKYIVKSVEGDKLSCDFVKEGMETKATFVSFSQVQRFVADGKWTISDNESATVIGGVVVATEAHHDITTEADVAEVNDIKPVVKPRAKSDGGSKTADVPQTSNQPAAIVKPMKTKPKAEPKPKAKTQPSAVKPQTSGKYVYSTYQTSRGKQGAKITGVSETDAAYQQAAAIHASGSYERDKQGNKHYYLCFGPRYAEAAKQVCELLNAGKPIEDAIAVVNAATEERAVQREEWKQKREERKAQAENKPKGEKPAKGEKTYTQTELAEWLRKLNAGTDKEKAAAAKFFNELAKAA